MKVYNQVDYLGDLRATQDLLERIKDYYKSRGISISNMRFRIEREMDGWGTRMYVVRSNLVYNVIKENLTIA